MIVKRSYFLVFSDIVVIIPTLDEELGIKPTICEMKEVLSNSRFLVVDGGSKDRTIEIAKDLGAEVLIQDGRGKGDAIRQGLDELCSNTRYVIFNDGDYTYPAAQLKAMISILNKNPEVGMVLGDRFNKIINVNCLVNPFFVGNRFFSFAQRMLNGLNLNDPLTGLRVIRYSLLKDWFPISDSFDIEAELNYHIERTGFSIVEIPISYRKRLGKKKLGFRHGPGILKRIIHESVNT